MTLISLTDRAIEAWLPSCSIEKGGQNDRLRGSLNQYVVIGPTTPRLPKWRKWMWYKPYQVNNKYQQRDEIEFKRKISYIYEVSEYCINMKIRQVNQDHFSAIGLIRNRHYSQTTFFIRSSSTSSTRRNKFSNVPNKI